MINFSCLLTEEEKRDFHLLAIENNTTMNDIFHSFIAYMCDTRTVEFPNLPPTGAQKIILETARDLTRKKYQKDRNL